MTVLYIIIVLAALFIVKGLLRKMERKREEAIKSTSTLISEIDGDNVKSCPPLRPSLDPLNDPYFFQSHIQQPSALEKPQPYNRETVFDPPQQPLMGDPKIGSEIFCNLEDGMERDLSSQESLSASPDIFNNFDLRSAVIYSVILKPKFQETV